MGIGGTWHNELGSTLVIAVDEDGNVTGEYTSAVGEAAGSYPLLGRCNNPVDAVHGAAIGWTVSWVNDVVDAHSVTTWSGQHFEAGPDPERITASWLLTSETTTAEVWESTVVGQDLFTRVPPDAGAVARLLRMGARSSHPLRAHIRA
ncbi:MULTISPECIES: avidin/streptavidin family protein [Actinosynnema]|uniref:avidin/streptavidin family protein n=1 Tax=Actinosynnema TaxID=40566 RepID=UPI0020A29307|nr:avidin/streptavidin family protein [Actinosynnema pretiosum]MCP2093961.1 Avidin family protein [Actinosynnema pretiosum]